MCLFFVTTVILAVACGEGDGDGAERPVFTPIPRESVSPEGFGFKSELVTEADFPVTLAFAPDGRLFYNERCGDIRIVTADGQLLPQPFARVDDVVCLGHWALTGLALDPDFDSNHYVYVFYMEELSSDPPIGAPRQIGS